MKNYLSVADWCVQHVDGNLPAEYQVSMLPPRPIPELPDWIHRLIQTSWYIQASDDSIFLFDCEFDPYVHKIDQIVKSQTGRFSGVDGIWISHYHDDHVMSVNDIIPPHKEERIRLTAISSPDPPHHREVLGLEVRFGARKFGEIAEAIVDYLEE